MMSLLDHLERANQLYLICFLSPPAPSAKGAGRFELIFLGIDETFCQKNRKRKKLQMESTI